MQHFILESQEEKFPAKNSSSAFDCFDWLYSWIEAADSLMVPEINFLRVS